MRRAMAAVTAALVLTALSPQGVASAALEEKRLSGSDRYRTAVAISQAHFSSSWGAVVASGANFPDALGAGPYAAAYGVPLLLVPPTGTLPSAVAAELDRLGVQAITVTGSAGAVSDGMLTQLQSHAAAGAYRVAGPDRFETAAALAPSVREGGRLFVANGDTFADALGGGAAAAWAQGALLLTKGSTLPAATVEALKAARPREVVVLGGASVVSSAVFSSIQKVVPTASVVRASGTNRFATAADISAYSFPSGARTVYLAAGTTFPDALAGAGVAGRSGAPLLLTLRDCVPAETRREISRLGASTVIALGGESVVSAAALRLTAC